MAPSRARIPESYADVKAEDDEYLRLLLQMQRLRGRLYLNDGAIPRSHLVEGRHATPIDQESWHVLVLDEEQEVRGCVRYRSHSPETAFSSLAASRSALAADPTWGPVLRRAVEAEMALARREGVSFVEVGGWALDYALRGSSTALQIAFASYCLGRHLGGAVGLSTVTRRHCASSILRRIGGRPVSSGEAIVPAYHDPQYGCEMEILQFYSWSPNPRYETWIDEMSTRLQASPVSQSTTLHTLVDVQRRLEENFGGQTFRGRPELAFAT